MKKSFKLSILIIIILIISTLSIMIFFPFGNSIYSNSKLGLKLSIPKLSFNIEIEQNEKINFKTFRSKSIIEVELRSMLNKFESYDCNNTTYYYDKNSNITITDYSISNSAFIKNVTLNYQIGKLNNNKCGIVTDYTTLKYSIVPVNETGYCYINEQFKYKDSNGNLYNVYYNCFGNLAFENGLGKMTYVDAMLSYGWLSMNDIINFLELQVKNKVFIKKEYDKYGSILYSNKDFSLLKCNTKSNNKNIYIDKEIEDRDYCK